MSSNYHKTDTYPDSRDSSDPGITIEGSRPGKRSEHAVQEQLLGSKGGDRVEHGVDSGTASNRNHYQRSLRLETSVQSGTALPHIDEIEQAEATKESPVTWRSLPRKDQLLVLTFARLSEPLTQTSLGSYIYYQLKSFDPSLPDSTISYQAGIMHAAFPGAQFLTAILWGRFADSEHGGRKRVIWIGLLGTMFSIIGFGFSHSFPMAVFFRCLGGVLNGNIGVMRTMISEIIKEKKYQSRAFIILPMTFNIGVIIGPILAGGLLADPVGSYPQLFGPGSPFGGKDGVQWMMKWPYALPNLLSAVFLFAATLSIFFFLEETSELCKHKPDPALHIGRWIRRQIFRQNVAPEPGYTAIPADEYAHRPSLELQSTPTTPHGEICPKFPLARRKLPFRRIWTRNVITTLLSHATMAMHVGTFNSLWFIYLSAPRYDPAHPQPPGFHPHGLHFTGGLALPPPRIGLALAILGVIGISLQLFLYPRLSQHLGPARSLRIFLAFFPITYFIVPFLSIVHSTSNPPAGVSGPLIWIAITVVLFIQVLARTFALPCTTILVNNCCPHPSVLGTVHGLGQSFSSLTRTFGPVMFGWIFGKGLDIGVVGLAWWILACVAVVGCVFGQFVREGDGHEILLEGEERGSDGVVKRVE
ncbi:MFS general substrate transporter [Byssothecium circinans]|uniref:MFS general substrate transporter n=1 Tax=Byssothecium circinans TaxID=147558 RepID=A0A6A5TMS1_9PLEO|nr:MFS general substrate transporter [Byssothecium circinans]